MVTSSFYVNIRKVRSPKKIRLTLDCLGGLAEWGTEEDGSFILFYLKLSHKAAVFLRFLLYNNTKHVSLLILKISFLTLYMVRWLDLVQMTPSVKKSYQLEKKINRAKSMPLHRCKKFSLVAIPFI